MRDLLRAGHQVGHQAGGGDPGSRSRALNEDRRLRVAIRADLQDVFRGSQSGRRVILGKDGEADPRARRLDAGQGDEPAALLPGFRDPRRELRIDLRKPFEEGLHRIRLKEVVREEGLDLDVSGFQVVSRGPPQDHELPDHIGEPKILAGVGFRDPLPLGLPYGLAEGGAPVDLIEEEGEGAREHTLHAEDPVTGAPKLGHGPDHPEPGADRGLVVDSAAPAEGGLAHGLILLGRLREGDLVGRHDRGSGPEVLWVMKSDLAAGGAVDHHEGAASRGGLHEPHRIFLSFGQGLPPTGGVQSLQVEGGGAAPCDSDQDGPDPTRRQRRLAVISELVQEGAPDASHSQHHDSHRVRLVRRGEEGSVHGPKGHGLVIRRNDPGDVSLRGALGDGVDIDLGVTEGGEESAGNPRRFPHSFPDDGEDRAVFLGHRIIQEAPVPLALELDLDGGNRSPGLRSRYRQGDRVRAGVLGEEEGVDVGGAEGTEESLRCLGDPDLLDPFESDECDIPDGRYPPDWTCRIGGRAGHHERPRKAGFQGASNAERKRRLPSRLHCRWAHHLGSEVSELEQLLVADLPDRARLGNRPRIRRKDPVHIGPDLGALRLQPDAQERGRVVRGSATQGGGVAGGGGADEARHHGDPRLAGEVLADQLLGGGLVDPSVTETVVGADEVAGVHIAGRDSAGPKTSCEEEGREELAEGKDPISRPEAALTQKLRAAGQPLELLEDCVHPGLQLLPLGLRGQAGEELPVPLLDLLEHVTVGVVPLTREVRHRIQRLGRASHGRNDDHGDRFCLGLRNEGGDVPDSLGVPEGASPELEHPNRAFLGKGRGAGVHFVFVHWAGRSFLFHDHRLGPGRWCLAPRRDRVRTGVNERSAGKKSPRPVEGPGRVVVIRVELETLRSHYTPFRPASHVVEVVSRNVVMMLRMLACIVIMTDIYRPFGGGCQGRRGWLEAGGETGNSVPAHGRTGVCVPPRAMHVR